MISSRRIKSLFAVINGLSAIIPKNEAQNHIHDYPKIVRADEKKK